MVNFNFKVDPDTLTLRDLIAFEEMQLDGKTMKTRDVANLVARFLVDDKGQPIDKAQAIEIVLDLNLTKLNEAAEKLKAAVLEVGAAQIPPA
jgi:hypothetical protein